jgi:acyl-CoA synthetase (AMP-forming)/AMP-acid ligase II
MEGNGLSQGTYYDWLMGSDGLSLQVKLRGFRVEPAEVEAALSTSCLVRSAVVVKAEAPVRLVAWVVLNCSDGDKEEAAAAAAAMMAAGGEAALRLHCARLLPPHQVPAQLLLLPGVYAFEGERESGSTVSACMRVCDTHSGP